MPKRFFFAPPMILDYNFFYCGNFIHENFSGGAVGEETTQEKW
jgi:hypothetical protein